MPTINAVNDNDEFHVEGPDRNGDVWLILPHSPVETVVNLGRQDKVSDVLANWLGKVRPSR